MMQSILLMLCLLPKPFILARVGLFDGIIDKWGRGPAFIIAFSLAGACFYLQKKINEKNASENPNQPQRDTPADESTQPNKDQSGE